MSEIDLVTSVCKSRAIGRLPFRRPARSMNSITGSTRSSITFQSWAISLPRSHAIRWANRSTANYAPMHYFDCLSDLFAVVSYTFNAAIPWLQFFALRDNRLSFKFTIYARHDHHLRTTDASLHREHRPVFSNLRPSVSGQGMTRTAFNTFPDSESATASFIFENGYKVTS